MRLTDDPRPLSLTKPDTSWPAEVQDVMAKALQRKREDRYDSASKFGIALYQAVEHMPRAAAAGATQMIGAMDGATAVIAPPPKTRLDASAAASPGASPATAVPVRSKMPVYAGAGVAALALAAAAFVYLPKSANKSGATPTSGPGAVAPSETSVTAPPVVRQQTAASPEGGGQKGATKGVEQLSTPLTPGTRPLGGNPSSSSAVSIDERIPALLRESSEDSSAARALKEAETLQVRAIGSSQIIGLSLVRAQALGMLGKDAQSCGILNTVKERSVTTPYGDRVAFLLKQTC